MHERPKMQILLWRYQRRIICERKLVFFSSIKELQGVEEYLFQKLEEVSAKNPGSKEGDQLIKEINRLTDLRNSLYGQLKILYADLANYSKIESGALKDQLASAKMLENRLNALKAKKARLTAASTDKLRMVEIGNYEYLRYSAHKSIMKVIAFTSLGVLFFSLLLKNKVVPSSLGSIGSFDHVANFISFNACGQVPVSLTPGTYFPSNGRRMPWRSI